MKRSILILPLLLLASVAAASPDPGPASAEMEPFAPLAGDWDCATFSPQQDGSVREGRARWRFWWILDGHALMDEWRAPKPDGSGEFVGVNIRQWDRHEQRYHAAWLEIGNLHWRSYACRWDDGVFTMLGDAEAPDGRKGLSRITFHDIRPDAFSWRMDWSSDGGATWTEGVFRIEATRCD